MIEYSSLFFAKPYEHENPAFWLSFCRTSWEKMWGKSRDLLW